MFRCWFLLEPAPQLPPNEPQKGSFPRKRGFDAFWTRGFAGSMCASIRAGLFISALKTPPHFTAQSSSRSGDARHTSLGKQLASGRHHESSYVHVHCFTINPLFALAYLHYCGPQRKLGQHRVAAGGCQALRAGDRAPCGHTDATASQSGTLTNAQRHSTAHF